MFIFRKRLIVFLAGCMAIDSVGAISKEAHEVTPVFAILFFLGFAVWSVYFDRSNAKHDRIWWPCISVAGVAIWLGIWLLH